MDFFKGFKAAGKGFAKGYTQGKTAESFKVAGKQVACPHCETSLFRNYTLGVNRPFAIAQVPSSSATCLVCANCSHILWFADSLEATSPSP